MVWFVNQAHSLHTNRQAFGLTCSYTHTHTHIHTCSNFFRLNARHVLAVSIQLNEFSHSFGFICACRYVSPTARSFIQGLLTRSPIRRLGARGVEQVKSHPFFSAIDWGAYDCGGWLLWTLVAGWLAGYQLIDRCCNPAFRSFLVALISCSDTHSHTHTQSLTHSLARALARTHSLTHSSHTGVLERMEVKAPFTPGMNHNPKDTRHFDPAVTALPLERQVGCAAAPAAAADPARVPACLSA
jgi:hypothetical protein